MDRMDSIEMVLERMEGWNPLKKALSTLSVNELKSMAGVTMEDYITV